jgi:hypothetical protein
MKYLGLDVHVKSTVWCLLDEEGNVSGRGQVETTVVAALTGLVKGLGSPAELIAGQEVGRLRAKRESYVRWIWIPILQSESGLDVCCPTSDLLQNCTVFFAGNLAGALHPAPQLSLAHAVGQSEHPKLMPVFPWESRWSTTPG